MRGEFLVMFDDHSVRTGGRCTLLRETDCADSLGGDSFLSALRGKPGDEGSRDQQAACRRNAYPLS
jgi:hypothetical protein